MDQLPQHTLDNLYHWHRHLLPRVRARLSVGDELPPRFLHNLCGILFSSKRTPARDSSCSLVS